MRSPRLDWSRAGVRADAEIDTPGLVPPSAAEAPYALSPMQSSMLYEALRHGDGQLAREHNIEQLHIRSSEPLDPSALGRAFSMIANLVPALGSSFEWEGSARPTQRRCSDLRVPIERAELPRERPFAELLARDRARGFDLRRAPLMRVTLFDDRRALLWTFHHLLLDGRSFAPVLDQVFRAYAAFQRGDPFALPAPARAYSDFIAWLESRDPEVSAPFFRALCAGRCAPTPLPAAEPAARPLPRSGGGRLQGRVPSGPLLALADSTRSSMAAIVQAAWALTLARFSGEDDVMFGGVRACRHSALDERAYDVPGLFMNTLPVRARLGAGSVRELLADLRAQSLAMRAHEHCALAEVQRFAGGSALFETVLMFDHRPLHASLCALDPTWETRELTLYERPALPLTVVVMQEPDALDVTLLYERARFSDAAIARVSDAFAEALASLARGADQPLDALEVLGPERRHQLLHAWNDTARAFPDQLRIHESFEARAASAPHAPALECRNETLSYAELDERANRLAHVLRAQGAGPGRFIGVCLERGFELVIALLGVAKSGAAYVPLDPDWPRERLAFMCESAAISCVITETAHAGLFERPTLVLDGDALPLMAAASSARPEPLGAADGPCYAIFTSGSTGQPKAVLLTHRAVVNTLDWVNRELAVGARDRLLFVTSHCFDLSVYDVFGALGAGATVVIAERTLLRDPEALGARCSSGRSRSGIRPRPRSRSSCRFSRRPAIIRCAASC